MTKLQPLKSSKEVKSRESWRKGYQQGQKEERQFILNILNGIDIADKEMGNKGGGTKAIRLALQSRIN